MRWILFMMLMMVSAVQAHPLAPALLQLRHQGDGLYDVIWRTSATRVRTQDVTPVLPERCRIVQPAKWVPAENESLTARWQVSCGPNGLTGATLRIDGLERSAINVIVVLDGHQVLLGSERSTYTVAETSTTPVWVAYLGLGIEHLLMGLDHLLLIVGLVLLVSGWRLWVWTITAFTLGHSVTLTLSVLDYLRLPQVLAEAAIALTLLLLAVELARGRTDTWMRRHPGVMAGVFGLIHGLGFASVLRDIGLPPGNVITALFGFNLGIEVGQLLIVAALLTVFQVWRRQSFVELQPLSARARVLAIYAIGSLAAYWLLDRLININML